jgi:hypothetical protein
MQMGNGSVDESEDETAAIKLGPDRPHHGKWTPVEYDPRPGDDGARRTIAYALIGLLSVIVVAILLLLAFSVIEADELKDFAVLLGPVITLVSAATGFYYGTKSK